MIQSAVRRENKGNVEVKDQNAVTKKNCAKLMKHNTGRKIRNRIPVILFTEGSYLGDELQWA